MKTIPYADLAAEALHFLRHHPTPGATVQGLADVLAACERHTFSAGDELCREGVSADALFFLLTGGVEVRKRGRDGAERKLGSVASPGLIGQIAVIDHSVRTASCVAEGPCYVAALPSAAFERLAAEPSAAGVTLRRLLLTSLSRQLAVGHRRVGLHLAALTRKARVGPAASLRPGPEFDWAGLDQDPAPSRRPRAPDGTSATRRCASSSRATSPGRSGCSSRLGRPPTCRRRPTASPSRPPNARAARARARRRAARSAGPVRRAPPSVPGRGGGPLHVGARVGRGPCGRRLRAGAVELVGPPR